MKRVRLVGLLLAVLGMLGIFGDLIARVYSESPLMAVSMACGVLGLGVYMGTLFYMETR